MEVSVPITGWLFLILAALCFFAWPNRLGVVAVFLTPFTATVVFNVTVQGHASGVQAAMLFGGLWMCRRVTDALLFAKIVVSKRRLLSLLFFVAIVLSASISLLVPAIYQGSLMIQSAQLYSTEQDPMRLSSRNLFQLLYLTYGVAFAWLVAESADEPRSFRLYIVTMIWSALFVSLWGLLQWIFHAFGWEYPYYIFNTTAHEAGKGYMSGMTGVGAVRLSSVAVEPSILAQFLVAVLPIALSLLYSEKRMAGRCLWGFVVLCVITTLMLSTSMTAYVGLVLVLLFVIAYYVFLVLKKADLVHLVFILSVLVILGWMGFSLLVQSDAVSGKLNSYSVQERLYSIRNSMEYFYQYPLTGVGWGSVTSHSMISGLLSNVGLLGAGIFGLWLAYEFRIFFRLLFSGSFRVPNNVDPHVKGVYLATLVLVLLSALVGFPYVFSYFWCMVGLLIAANSEVVSELEGIKILRRKVEAPFVFVGAR